jgi:hypothetical protein
MKNKYGKSLPFVLCILCCSLQSNAQYFRNYLDSGTQSEDGISIHIVEPDSGSVNVWMIGEPSKAKFNVAYSLPNALMTDSAYYPENNVSSFIVGTRVDELKWNDIAAFKWIQKLDFFALYDGGYIEFSVDTGKTWENVFESPYVYNLYGFDPDNKMQLSNGQTGFSSTDLTWREIWLCFEIHYLSTVTDSFMLKFTMISDSVNNENEGWLIDNFLFEPTLIHTVEEIPQEEYIEIFPNPARDKLHIQVRKEKGFHIIENLQLMDESGKILKEYKLVPLRFFIDVTDYSPGTYILRIQTNKHTEIRKIIIE